MTHDNGDLAALIGARICHDLISPIGAITNGLELMTMAGAGAGPELDLISTSVENAGARIRFFRIAFGAAHDQPVDRGEIRSIFGDLYRGSRISACWSVPGDAPRRDVRLAFLAIMCCEKALPHGGTIEVGAGDDGWTVQARGDRLKHDPVLWSMLSDHRSGAATPALVQFALLPVVATEAGRRLSVEVGAEVLTLTIRR